MDGRKVIRKKCDFGQFGAFWTPFGALGTQREFYEKKLYSAQLHMKIQLAAKFEKNLMDGYPAIVRTDGRTDERTDERTGLITIVPFRLKSGD